MILDDYIAERGAHDPEFKKALEDLTPEYEFRRALIAARIASGLTQAELAERAGAKPPAIARLESGSSQPSLAMLRRLARALDVTFRITSAGTHVEAANSPGSQPA